MLSVAVSWDLYLQTHSAKVLGAVGFVQVLPSFAFAILAGHIADRYNRRMIMLVAQALTVFASLLLALGVHGVTWIYACLFLIAVTRTFQMPIRGAVLPDLVPPEAAPLECDYLERHDVRIGENVGLAPALAGILLAMTSSRIMIYTAQARLRDRCTALPGRPDFSAEAYSSRPVRRSKGYASSHDNKLILSAVSAGSLLAYLFGGATALAFELRGRHFARGTARAEQVASRAVGWRHPHGDHDGALAAHPPRWSRAALERRRIRSRDHRLRTFPLDLASSCAMLALSRRIRQHQRRASPVCAANQDSGFRSRPRDGGEQHLHQLLEFAWRRRIGLDGGMVRPNHQRGRRRCRGDCRCCVVPPALSPALRRWEQ